MVYSVSAESPAPKVECFDECWTHNVSPCAFISCNSVLGAYIVFAIADTAFKITPDKPYIQMLMEAITGSGGGEASS